ncbi:MAG: 2OG-Fe(II) oxygenase [Alphaproteobacteria bacterium]
MTNQSPNTDAFLASLAHCRAETAPFRHWFLDDALAPEIGAGIADLPVAPPGIDDCDGTREANNNTRVYFDAEMCDRHPACAETVATFKDAGTIAAIERTCGIDLAGGQLRIEYTQDRTGFWLEPHTDISVKMFTMLIYLGWESGLADCGTDIYDGDRKWVGRAAYGFNKGLVFIPGSDTWHGYAPRPIDGVRKSIIVNYVTDAWRDRFELAP